MVTRKGYLVDPADIDFDNVIADVDEIRKYNPQRFEMEQLTAIVYVDEATMTCAGYKDIKEDEVWVRGHMPGMPIIPLLTPTVPLYNAEKAFFTTPESEILDLIFLRF
jgi:3-hydroxyacyl-[acyl-carrier-protein] dehydratase